MWDTKEMVPYFGSSALEIKDSLAYLKYNSSERVIHLFMIVCTIMVTDL